MKKILLSILLLPFISSAQNYPSSGMQSLQGKIIVPDLMNMHVMSTHNQAIRIKNMQEVAYGKYIRNYMKIKVKSNRPWIISVMSNNKYLTSTSGASELVPVDIFSLQPEGIDQEVILTNTPQVLIQSNNNALENNYFINLKVGPTFNYNGGRYYVDFIFTLTPL